MLGRLPSVIVFLVRTACCFCPIVVAGCHPLTGEIPTDLSWTSRESIGAVSSEKSSENASEKPSGSIASADSSKKTFERCVVELQNPDVLARVGAVEGLGKLGTFESIQKLHEQLKTADERTRTAAVTALAHVGDQHQVLIEAADDRSWRVRKEAAKALAQFPNRSTADVLRKLLDDPNVMVQLESVRATADWPLELSGPILFKGLEKTTYRPRASAAEQLASLWPSGLFPVDGPLERRRQILSELRQRYQHEIGPLPVDQPLVKKHPTKRPTPTPGKIARIDRLLDHLASSDLAVRRWASAELAKLTAERSLEDPAAWRLAQVASTEQDDLVWKNLLRVIAKDPSESSIQLAYAAIGHRSPEIRRRACQYLGRHPHSSHTDVLLPAVRDPSETVVVAAVRALSAIGQIDRPDAIRDLLIASNETIRLEAAIALVRLDDPAGPAALRRLAASPHEQVRLRTAVAMGEVPEPSFTSMLIEMLDDRQSIRRAALESLPKVVGYDVSEKNGSASTNLTERIACWKYWFSRSATIVLDDSVQKETIEE